MSIIRPKIGILFNFSAQWMGGIIYIINIVQTLNLLDDDEKPEIYLFYRSELKEFIDDFTYPYISKIGWSFPAIVKGNIQSVIKGENLFINEILKRYSLDAIFPIHDFPVKTSTSVKLISWWADLQHKYYPEFFSPTQLLGRNIRTRHILRNCNNLVVSSQAVLDDFTRFYRLRDDLNIHIFHFVSVINGLENTQIDDLTVKYKLPDEYFLVSNQFHKHKNHKVLLLSLARLKTMGIRKHMAFTGKFPAATDSLYLSELHKIIEDNKLHDQVTMLGLISRNDQLHLMKYSQAVLQPSLFEGWSTVIEDAKSLQVPVVASDLKVNKEQLGENGVYFDPHNPDELASILSKYPKRNLNDVFYENYASRTKKAAKELLSILVG